MPNGNYTNLNGQNQNISAKKFRIPLKMLKKDWSLINTLLGRKGKQTNVKQLIIDDIIISDDKSIAESFNDYFINVGINIATESEQLYDISSDDQMPEANIEHYPDIRFKFADINVNNVATSLSDLKVSKATGMDNTPAKTLKMSSYIIAPLRTAIFSMSLKSGVYIDEWKLARVIPIYQSENRSKCENYRPISMHSAGNKQSV